ncbi:MAG: NF038143 family protein [Pseudomonadota bacterium]
METKSKRILSAEEALARKVALGIIVRRPVNLWLQMIPGMFIMEYLKRGLEIRRVARVFMPPRHLAMKGALSRIQGDLHQESPGSLGDIGRSWLKSLNVYSADTDQALTVLVRFLSDHYVKLLQAPGETCVDTLREVYAHRAGYKAHLSELTQKELAFDQSITGHPANRKAMRQMILEGQGVLAEQREKDVDALFL